jgi:predicted 2-oxoglutarate/Fe(II)-dependent dioxygenase YbiX
VKTYTYSKELTRLATLFPDTNLKPRIGNPVITIPNVLPQQVTRETYFNVHKAKAAKQTSRATVYTADGKAGVVMDTNRRTDIFSADLMPNASLNYERLNDLISKSAQAAWGVKELIPCSSWWLAGYGVGDRFTAHCDGAIQLADGQYKAVEQRLISAIFYVNTKDAVQRGWGYTGGELKFTGILDEDGVPLTIHPREGDLVIFPSSYAYTHEVPFITSGYRVAATNFFKLKG